MALRDSDILTDGKGKYLEYLQLDIFINFIHCATSSSEKQQLGLEGARSQGPQDSRRAVSEKGGREKGSEEQWKELGNQSKGKAE